MITIEQVKLELLNEVKSKENVLKVLNFKGKYFNDILPEVSSSLSVLLSATLIEFLDWEANFWIDDILLTKVLHDKDAIKISGLVIYGNHHDDRQWVAPLNSIILDSKVEFYFVDENNIELVSYEEFIVERDRFDFNFTKKGWKYITAI